MWNPLGSKRTSWTTTDISPTGKRKQTPITLRQKASFANWKRRTFTADSPIAPSPISLFLGFPKLFPRKWEKFPQFTTYRYYISLFYHISSQKRLVFSQPLENIERFFGHRSSFLPQLYPYFFNTIWFSQKRAIFSQKQGFLREMLGKRLCGSPPLSTFAPSVRGTRGPRWQANKIIIKGREKARRKKRVMSMYFSFTVWRFLFSLSMSCSKKEK